jgi:hypothetical protein
MMMPAVVRKLARSAGNMSPLTWALVLGVVVLAIVLGFRLSRREGWSFREQKSLNTPEAKKHSNYIWGKCAQGMSVDDIMKNGDWDYLSKYRKAEVEDVCNRAANSAKISAREGQGTSVSCGNRKPCPAASLKSRQPCMNSNGTKCCAYTNGKVSNCSRIPKDIDAKWAGALDANAGKCSRAKCPDFNLRGDYPCLNNEGTHCCNGTTRKCAPLATKDQKGKTVKIWQCRGADGSDQGKTTLTWGYSPVDAAWACNTWVAACGGKCTGEPGE